MLISMARNLNKGFSLLEMLLVVLLIGLLAGIASLSYSRVLERSRDSKRKTDLEELRSALEQYRSNNNTYPTANPTLPSGLSFGTAGLQDGSGNIYMQKLPQDPLYNKRNYFYSASTTDFTLSTELENPNPTPCLTPPGDDSCGIGYGCNYCLGAYGEK